MLICCENSCKIRWKNLEGNDTGYFDCCLILRVAIMWKKAMLQLGERRTGYRFQHCNTRCSVKIFGHR